MLIVLSIALLTFVAWTSWQGVRDYARFVKLTDSASRQRCYWRWTAWGLGVTGLVALASLWLVGRVDAVVAYPSELISWSAPETFEDKSPSVWGGFAFGAAVSVAAPIVIWRRRIASMRLPVAGEIEALLPRNTAERIACIPLSFSAAIGEELLFRLALPLVVTLATGSAIAGFAVATVAFALSHVYQGWKGVLATGGMGVLLAASYVASGSLLRPIVLHAAIDLLALVVRPIIAARVSGPLPGTAT